MVERSVWAGLAVGLMTTPATASLPPEVVLWAVDMVWHYKLPPPVAGWLAAWIGGMLSVISGTLTAHAVPDRQWTDEERRAKLGGGS